MWLEYSMKSLHKLIRCVESIPKDSTACATYAVQTLIHHQHSCLRFETCHLINLYRQNIGLHIAAALTLSLVLNPILVNMLRVLLLTPHSPCLCLFALPIVLTVLTNHQPYSHTTLVIPSPWKKNKAKKDGDRNGGSNRGKATKKGQEEEEGHDVIEVVLDVHTWICLSRPTTNRQLTCQHRTTPPYWPSLDPIWIRVCHGSNRGYKSDYHTRTRWTCTHKTTGFYARALVN